MWGAVGVLGLGALIAGVTAWGDGQFSGRAKLGIAIGTAVVAFFVLVVMEAVAFEGVRTCRRSDRRSASGTNSQLKVACLPFN